MGSTPGLIFDQVPTAAQWNSYFAAKQDDIGSTPLSLLGGVMQGTLITIAPTLASAGFVLPHGVSPTTPVNGALWTTSAGLFAQVNGATVGPYIASAAGGVSAAGNNNFTGNNTFSGNTTFNTGVVNITGTFQLGGVAVALGTSGATVPFLNGSNTWAGSDNFTGTFKLGGVTVPWPTTVGTAGQVLTSQAGGVMTWTTPATGVVPNPQGRVTLTSATPVMTASATGAQTLYYAPYTGNQIGLYNGTSMVAFQFTSSATDNVGLSIALAGSANWVANTLYDVFVAYNAGTPTLCTGPAWTNATTRSAAGSLGLYAGFLVNSNASAMTGRTGAGSTISIPQYQATYVGTIAIDAGTAGQVSFTLGTAASGGGASFLNIWNYYNRVGVATTVTDTSATYTYQTSAIRSANNSTTNRITFVSGLAEDAASITYMTSTTIPTSGNASSGVGIDSTTAFAYLFNYNTAPGTALASANTGVMPPQIGLHFIQALEKGDGANSNNFNWNSLNALMTVLRM